MVDISSVPAERLEPVPLEVLEAAGVYPEDRVDKSRKTPSTAPESSVGSGGASVLQGGPDPPEGTYRKEEACSVLMTAPAVGLCVRSVNRFFRIEDEPRSVDTGKLRMLFLGPWAAAQAVDELSRGWSRRFAEVVEREGS